MRPLARVQAEALRQRGVDVLLVTSDQHPESDAARDYELVLDPRFRRAATWPATLAAWRRVREYRADVVLTELVVDPRWIAMAGRVPRVQLVHDDRPHDPAEQLRAYKRPVIDRWGAGSAATVTYSDYVAAAVATRRDVAGTPVHVLPLCSDLDPALVPPLVGPEGRRDFVLMGRLNPYKNVDVVLEAWQRHVAGGGWRGDDLVLLGDGPVSARTLPEHTQWRAGTYRYADVITTLASAKGSISHYRRASQSGVQVLSMQLGVMPIVSTAGGLPEFQPPGCPPVGVDDIAGLASAFDELADPSSAAGRGAAAADHYVDRFAVDRVADGLLGVISEVLAARSPGRSLAAPIAPASMGGAVTREPVGLLQSDLASGNPPEAQTMIRTAIVGLGKMGLSHLAILNSHPDLDIVGICDSVGYVRDVLTKYTGLPCYDDFDRMLVETKAEAVVVAVPSRLHAPMVEKALTSGTHVFCEKPFVLDASDGERLVALAESRRLVTQVGYHYRFVGAFKEAARIVASGALGRMHHVRGEAYGPVVLREKGSTWRGVKAEGGGALYDYACHAIDLMNFIAGAPDSVDGVVRHGIFSRDVDDEVYCTLRYANGATGQLSVNWSDESFRKMSTKVSVWGTNGRIIADRQECQIYLRETHPELPELAKGWTIRYTTDLTEEVWYYLRGEEYSAQIDYFAESVKANRVNGENTFRSALDVDRVVDLITGAALSARSVPPSQPVGNGYPRVSFRGEIVDRIRKLTTSKAS